MQDIDAVQRHFGARYLPNQLNIKGKSFYEQISLYVTKVDIVRKESAVSEHFANTFLINILLLGKDVN